MANQESLPPFITAGQVYNIKFGKSLIDKPRRKHDHSYQSVSFDFKPISLNATKAAKLSVNHEDHSMTISVPRETAASGRQEPGAEAAESTLFEGKCMHSIVYINLLQICVSARKVDNDSR